MRAGLEDSCCTMRMHGARCMVHANRLVMCTCANRQSELGEHMHKHKNKYRGAGSRACIGSGALNSYPAHWLSTATQIYWAWCSNLSSNGLHHWIIFDIGCKFCSQLDGFIWTTTQAAAEKEANIKEKGPRFSLNGHSNLSTKNTRH